MDEAGLNGADAASRVAHRYSDAQDHRTAQVRRELSRPRIREILQFPKVINDSLWNRLFATGMWKRS